MKGSIKIRKRGRREGRERGGGRERGRERYRKGDRIDRYCKRSLL